jgi:hypothetical protein
MKNRIRKNKRIQEQISSKFVEWRIGSKELNFMFLISFFNFWRVCKNHLEITPRCGTIVEKKWYKPDLYIKETEEGNDKDISK